MPQTPQWSLGQNSSVCIESPKFRYRISNKFSGERQQFLKEATLIKSLLDCFKVRDLLGKDQSVRLEVKERPDVGVYVKELSVFMVNNADDMDKLMTVGNRWGSLQPILFRYLGGKGNVNHVFRDIPKTATVKTQNRYFSVGKYRI